MFVLNSYRVSVYIRVGMIPRPYRVGECPLLPYDSPKTPEYEKIGPTRILPHLYIGCLKDWSPDYTLSLCLQYITLSHSVCSVLHSLTLSAVYYTLSLCLQCITLSLCLQCITLCLQCITLYLQCITLSHCVCSVLHTLTVSAVYYTLSLCLQYTTLSHSVCSIILHSVTVISVYYTFVSIETSHHTHTQCKHSL